MDRCFRIALGTLLTLTSLMGLRWLGGAVPTANTADKPHVILVSIDGLRPAYYLNPQQFGVKLPNLQKLMESGSYAKAVTTVYPSVTYPAHTTLVTGVRPVKHGVDFNTIFDPKDVGHWYSDAKHIKVEPLWEAARKGGLKTAGILWPVTLGAQMDVLIPVPDIRNFLLIFAEMRRRSTPGLIDRIERRFGYKLESASLAKLDNLIGDAAVDIIENDKPNLLVIHFFNTDQTQHSQGLDAPEVKAAFETVDAQIGRMMEAARKAGADAQRPLAEQTTFIVTGDHGFASVHTRINPNVLLKEKGLLTVSNDGKVQNWQVMAHSEGGSIAIMLKDPKDRALTQRVRALFQEASRDDKGATLFRIVERKELDALGAMPMAAFALEASAGFYFGETWNGTFLTSNIGAKGTHGYLPGPEMDTGFIISGRGAARGKVLERIHQTDIAPTAARLLGVTLPQVEGKAVRAVLGH